MDNKVGLLGRSAGEEIVAERDKGDDEQQEGHGAHGEHGSTKPFPFDPGRNIFALVDGLSP